MDNEEIMRIMRPLSKKYNLMVKNLNEHKLWSYKTNTIDWVGRELMPRSIGRYLICYNVLGNELIIFDQMSISGSKLDVYNVDDLVKQIDVILEMNEHTNGFILRHDIESILVPNGKFVCWKKCYIKNANFIRKSVMVKLEVPEGAKRYQELGEFKFRVSEAKVLGLYNTDGKKINKQEAYSPYDNNFKYRVGHIVKPDKWDNKKVSCSHGIHAFMRFDDAWQY